MFFPMRNAFQHLMRVWYKMQLQVRIFYFESIANQTTSDILMCFEFDCWIIQFVNLLDY